MTSNAGNPEERDLLRLVIVGSVDDGKSTLLGRLLYDSRALFEDHVQSVKEYSEKNRGRPIDFSLFTDGLKAEREQGITIDVAYRYFSTPSRRYIVADAPGHEQYTRNMVTSASLATAAVILVDATRGIMTQTRRHTFLSALLGIRHIVVAINKMDLVGYDRKVFEHIVRNFLSFSGKFRIESIRFIPVCAIDGENVTRRSAAMPWYEGPPLLEYLDTLHVPAERNLIDLRLPVQMAKWAGRSRRGYMGSVASGIIRTGDEIVVLPSMKKSRVEKILTGMEEQSYAFASQAVTVYLAEDLDISRGDMIVREANVPCHVTEVEAILVWLDDHPLRPGKIYMVKHTTRSGRGSISSIRYRFDMETFHRHKSGSLSLNQIGKVVISLLNPFFMDEYTDNRQTGCFILIDPESNQTSAAGMVTRCSRSGEARRPVSTVVRGDTHWVVEDISGTAALTLLHELRSAGCIAVLLDPGTEPLAGVLRTPEASDEEVSLSLARMARLINESGAAVVVRADRAPDSVVQETIGNAHLILARQNPS